MIYLLHLFIFLCVYVIVAMSLNIVVGYCGLLSLAHASFFALGGYTYALLSLKLGWGLIPAVGVAVGLAVVLSLTLSLPALRMKGDFYAVVTIAVQAFFFSALNNWYDPNSEPGTLSNLTNGSFGLAGIPKPSVGGYEFVTVPQMAVLAFVVTAICAAVLWSVLISPWGRALKAMRDNELAARGIGKHVRNLKIQAVAWSVGIIAVAGALYASYVGYIDPNSATLAESILMLSMVMVGGAGNFRGPLVGALVLLAIPELLRFADVPEALGANIRLMIYGLLLIVMMQVRPQGIAGEYRLG